MRFACWLRKAADTHSDHVIFTVCPRKQCLRESASIVHYTFVVYLFITNCYKFSVRTQNFVPIGTNFVTKVNFNRSETAHLHVCVCVCVFVCVCVCVVWVCVSMCMYIYIYIYIHCVAIYRYAIKFLYKDGQSNTDSNTTSVDTYCHLPLLVRPSFCK